MANVSQILIDATAALELAGIAEPRREASSLLVFALGRDRTFLIAHPEYAPTDSERRAFDNFLARRSAREPLQYITGRQEFYGLDFAVSPDVLIPRPETEAIVEHAIEFLREFENPRFCEVGVGSGCISVAILANLPDAFGLGLDVSGTALEAARLNAHRHDVGSRFETRLSDVFCALEANESFDAIVSNPPYVPAGDMQGLQPEVRDFEPLIALSDGADGLSIVKRIIDGAPRFLRSGGLLLIEIGVGQSAETASFVDCSIWSSAEFLSDLQGIPRTLKIFRK
ncbi:MAG: peptide chain release factor N(5)-glutamine methyltransferase [Acidobacteria bacterium]|nr:peptide chain release factor N(5)-glutamine methyltransferase [Acidobacteriota bacterium]